MATRQIEVSSPDGGRSCSSWSGRRRRKKIVTPRHCNASWIFDFLFHTFLCQWLSRGAYPLSFEIIEIKSSTDRGQLCPERLNRSKTKREQTRTAAAKPQSGAMVRLWWLWSTKKAAETMGRKNYAWWGCRYLSVRGVCRCCCCYYNSHQVKW